MIICLSACAMSPQVEYDNFVTDLDLICRFEETAFNIEFGRWSETFQKDIIVLLKDLKTFRGDDPKSIAINNQLIKSANAFLIASREYYADNDEKGDENYNYAINKYKEAITNYHDYVSQDF